MANFIQTSATWFRYFLFLVATALIVYIIPKTGKFQFDYEKNEDWKYETLEAPFTFPVKKSEAELEEERQSVKQRFKPFYRRRAAAVQESIRVFQQQILPKAYQEHADKSLQPDSFYQQRGRALLKSIYQRGVIKKAKRHKKANKTRFRLVEDKEVSLASFDEFLTVQEAASQLERRMQQQETLSERFFVDAVTSAVEANIRYDRQLSKQRLEELLDDISVNYGLVEEGETIIAQGATVTEERYRTLRSLESAYESQTREGLSRYIIFGGYSLLVLFIIAIFGVYLSFFKQDVIRSTKSLLLILSNIVVFILLTVYVNQNETLSIYLIPYAVLPIIMLAFFGPRVAIMAHLVVVLVGGLFVPSGLEFVFLQLTAGFMSILAMSRIRYLSQFFIASILIAFSYYVSFLGLKFIEVSAFQSIQWINLLWFTGNFVLTLLAYPLIYAHEKLFGFITDITLIEYADINKKVLRRLSMRAPGTFQHSLQVANLTETVLNEIGGNALLARVGALYHDIGKMDNPEYFIENQRYMDNPHNNLSYEDSARVIISHVPKGVEKARQLGLPEQITKFIRTHHGSARVEYFYRNYLKQLSNDEVADENKFRYPGPKPFSRETAVVMIIDSIEAASRSQQDPTEEEINTLIDSIMDSKLKDNQLEKADITMREFNIIRNRLKRLMKSIYHVRVKYPERKEEPVNT